MGKLNNQKGFTIVELLVAAVILVVVAFALLRLYSQNFGWIVNAGYRTEAIDNAKSALDAQIALGTSSEAETLEIRFSGTDVVKLLGETLEATGTGGPGSSTVVTLNTFVTNKPYIAP